jgi:PAS domain S-box-containing protein
MFGYSQEEIIGKAISSLIVPEDLRREEARFAGLLAQGQTVSVETFRVKAERLASTRLFRPPATRRRFFSSLRSAPQSNSKFERA